MRLRSLHQGHAPGRAEASACYGSRIAAVFIYLHIGQTLSKKRTALALTRAVRRPGPHQAHRRVAMDARSGLTQ